MKARLFAVVIQRVPERDLSRAPNWAGYPFPVMTAQFVSQLADASRGRIFKRTWDLKTILAETRKQ